MGVRLQPVSEDPRVLEELGADSVFGWGKTCTWLIEEFGLDPNSGKTDDRGMIRQLLKCQRRCMLDCFHESAIPDPVLSRSAFEDFLDKVARSGGVYWG